MKKLPIVLACVSLLGIGSLASCSTGDSNVKNIGILQVATHDALDLDLKGFIAALEENGFKEGENIKITVQNPEGESSKQNTIAKSLVGSNDLVFGISTGSAQALKTAAINAEKDIPILFSAATDPVTANIVSSSDYKQITGTSDAGDTKKNISLFKEFPNITSIGVLFNQAEVNSQIQKDETEVACKELGLSFRNQGITSATSVKSAFQGLIGQGIQGLFIPTDNLIAENISFISEVAKENKIVIVCADTLVVGKGGSLGYGVDYEGLGKLTGKMAAQILKGEKEAKDIAWSKSDSFSLEINEQYFKDAGITIPDSIRALL